jgi:hypothetical protein
MWDPQHLTTLKPPRPVTGIALLFFNYHNSGAACGLVVRAWLQIQRSGFYSRRYQIFWEVVGLKRGPLSLVSTTQKLLERKSSGSGLESREYGRRDPSRWPRGDIYSQKLVLTSPISCGRSVDIVRSRTQAKEFLSQFWTLSIFSSFI